MSPSANRQPLGRLAVLVSGNGSNLQAVLDACHSGRLAANVAVVVSNNPEAFALVRAERCGVATLVAPQGGRSRHQYDAELADAVSAVGVDLVVLAGWDRVLCDAFVAKHTVVNLHPAKPGAFPGLGAIERAYEAWRAGSIMSGGVMVHFVPDEGVDCGPVIATEDVAFQGGDTLDSFTSRVHEVEHRVLVDAIAEVLSMAEERTLR